MSKRARGLFVLFSATLFLVGIAVISAYCEDSQVSPKDEPDKVQEESAASETEPLPSGISDTAQAEAAQDEPAKPSESPAAPTEQKSEPQASTGPKTGEKSAEPKTGAEPEAAAKAEPVDQTQTPSSAEPQGGGTVPAAGAQEEDSAASRNVVSVEVRGNQIISTNTILNRLQTKAGGKLVQETINADIKRLYATGFFYDIKFEVEPVKDGYRVILIVDEKPIVRQIIIDGNKVFKEQKLRKDINLLEGQIL
ncbi:MAG: POTRA domain-containing protein, partial [Candidatus Omnitrophica bacterium]|nr:POTRA domain-containing protein [Candidatus Omnitrophota bacterium]